MIKAMLPKANMCGQTILIPMFISFFFIKTEILSRNCLFAHGS